MSDGDYEATLGYRRAAPWERFCAPERNDAVHRWQAEPANFECMEPAVEPEAGDDDAVGCHASGGISVADLIAKFGAPTAGRPRHHHHARDTVVEPDISIALQDTQVIDTPAYSLDIVSELPDLEDEPYVDESEFDETTEAPAPKR